MPCLKRTEAHACPFCQYSSIRKDIKKHFISIGKKGPRCSGLKKKIPGEVWKEKILPYYKGDQPLPDLSAFIRRPGRKCSSWTDASPRTKRRRSGEIECTLAKSSKQDRKFILNALMRIMPDETAKKNAFPIAERLILENFRLENLFELLI